MNTQHLKYIVEIERTRSISQAAENLYIAQPNLSRILHEMERELAFTIFERTTSGYRPTERGAAFLQHAKAILREQEMIEALGPHHTITDSLRILIPRSYTMLQKIADFLATSQMCDNYQVSIQEVHSRNALELMKEGKADLAVIRFRKEYQEYFETHAQRNQLAYRKLRSYEFRIMMKPDHPLASAEFITKSDYEAYPEIVHSDYSWNKNHSNQIEALKIYAVDRQSQLQLLRSVHNAFIWCEPMNNSFLEREGFVQKKVHDHQGKYIEAVLYHKEYDMRLVEQQMLEIL